MAGSSSALLHLFAVMDAPGSCAFPGDGYSDPALLRSAIIAALLFLTPPIAQRAVEPIVVNIWELRYRLRTYLLAQYASVRPAACPSCRSVLIILKTRSPLRTVMSICRPQSPGRAVSSKAQRPAMSTCQVHFGTNLDS